MRTKRAMGAQSTCLYLLVGRAHSACSALTRRLRDGLKPRMLPQRVASPLDGVIPLVARVRRTGVDCVASAIPPTRQDTAHASWPVLPDSSAETLDPAE